MFVCVECGEQFEDFHTIVNYFICHECMVDIE
jgi:hypothetical protein